jgi:hypothetical protein
MVPNTKPYKDIRNRFRTESLFIETYKYESLDPEVYVPVWTLREFPHKLPPNHVFYDKFPDHTVPALRDEYMRIMDPTEYRFAEEVFGSFRHWKILREAKFMQDVLPEWRDSLQSKLKAEAVRIIRNIANSGDKSSLQAAKWLAEKGYIEKDHKGRPSKKDIAQKLVEEANQAKLLQEDAERIGISAGG